MSEDKSGPSYEKWVREVTRLARRRVEIELRENGAVRLSGIRAKPLDLVAPPLNPDTGSPMDLEVVVIDGAEHELKWTGQFNSVNLRLDDLKKRTVVTLGRTLDVAVVGTATPTEEGLLELRLEETETVSVEKAWIHLPESVRELKLVDAGLTGWSGGADEIRLEGSISLKSVRFDCAVEGYGPLVLSMDDSSVMDSIKSSDDEIHIVKGHLTLMKRSLGNDFRLNEGVTLRVDHHALVSNGRISGKGSIDVHGGLRDVVIDQCPLIVRSTGFAVDVSGTPQYIQLDQGAAVVAPENLRAGYLTPTQIRAVSGASLEMVSVHSLGIADLAALESLESFSIQTANRQRDRFKEAADMTPSAIEGPGLAAEKVESVQFWRRISTSAEEPLESRAGAERRAQVIEESAYEAEKTARAHFWRRLSTILAEKGARGEVQSRARAISAEMRRQSLRWGRERFWLSVYRRVGYGESILTPLLWHLGFSLAFMVALWLTGTEIFAAEDSVAPFGFLRGLLQVAISPLAFFRFTERPYLGSDFYSIVFTVISVIGLLMIFFSLAALRRVTKAE